MEKENIILKKRITIFQKKNIIFRSPIIKENENCWNVRLGASLVEKKCFTMAKKVIIYYNVKITRRVV